MEKKLPQPLMILKEGLPKVKAPVGAFEPGGDWENRYLGWDEIPLRNENWETGGLRVRKKLLPDGSVQLQVLQQKNLMGRRGFERLNAKITCKNDLLCTPVSWELDWAIYNSKGKEIELTRNKVTGELSGGSIVHHGEKDRRIKAPPKLTSNWCLVDAVQRLPFDCKPISFALFEDHEAMKPDQVLCPGPGVEVQIAGAPTRLHSFVHIGPAILPYSYWLDDNHRLLLICSGPCNYLYDPDVAVLKEESWRKQSREPKTGITRREFICGAALGAAGLAAAGSKPLFALPQAKKSPPNLLFIQTDQQHFEALSGLGNKLLRTPNMDRLLRRGTSFSMSYSPAPLCGPARSGWYTGRTPSENGMLDNNHRLRPDFPDLGQWLGSRGYECFYTGKWHQPGRDCAKDFKVITCDLSHQGQHHDAIVSRSAEAFLRNYRGDKPFFLSVGFLQPHDTCHWGATHYQNINELASPAIERDLPPLPPNFNSRVAEPAVLAKQLEALRNESKNWPELHWRYYMWCYYRDVEMVDAQFGRVLDALEDSRFADNTLIVFTVDHGDGLARRGLTTKWFTYDEAARVPLVICLPGNEGHAAVDRTHVVSGLDFSPTLCDFAGVEAMPKARGRSLRPLVEGRSVDWREFVVAECNITGRMLRTPEYKLVAYQKDPVLQLFDMRKDPWEMTNLAQEAKHATTVADLQKRLSEWESRLEPLHAS